MIFFSYELQLEPGVIRRGLGKFMMQILELVAFKNNMRKVVLTVLKNNQNSVFFKKLKLVLFFFCFALLLFLFSNVLATK